MSSDRSTLEGKERAELVVIAEAMGNKVTSRMRKAAIVDLIVGSSAGDDDASSASPKGRGAADNDLADSDTPTDSDTPGSDVADSDSNGRQNDGSHNDDSHSDDADDDAGEGDDSDDSESDDSGSSDEQSSDSGNGRNRGNSDRGGRGKRDKGNADRGNSDKRDADKGNADKRDNDRGNSDKGDSDRGNSDRANSSDAGNDAGDDPNNKRRRRRRGRDRDELPWEGEPLEVDGYLDLRNDGYGFLRVSGALASRDDCYVPVKMVRQYGLRSGDQIRGTSRPAARNEKNPALLSVDAINERDPEEARNRPDFEDLVPIFPTEQLVLERATTPADLTTRIIDLVAPIGKGQRGLIVAPPKAGKTTVIKEIVRSIETNNPEVHLIVLLVDERPEEVTDMQRWLKKGEVVASTFDRPSDEHMAVAEMVGERARRMVESGRDVCVIMDGITRLARAYNVSGRFTGRTMSGGVDAGALYPSKRLFGSARNVENGGSLTIIATALVDTGSRMDEVIFEEFKGTGNMELRLDRSAAERRMFPAVDIAGSSTRHDELLMSSKDQGATTKMRRVLDAVGDEGQSRTIASLDLLLDRLANFKTNADFLAEVASSK